MPSKRLLPHVAAASLLVGLAACGGSTQFAGAQPFSIGGTPPPPPPAPAPAPPPPPEEPKPPPRVELRDNKIEIKEKIQFEVNKAIIKPESFSLLKEIGDVIKKNTQVKKLSIEGHASAEGDAKANKKLSEERAKSVMDHLVKKEGIEAGKLVAKGWGIEKPIAGNEDEPGREKNRRVEFLVIEQDVTQKKVEIDHTGQEKTLEEKKDTHKVDTGTPTPDQPKTPDPKKLLEGKKVDVKKPAPAAAPKPAEKK